MKYIKLNVFNKIYDEIIVSFKNNLPILGKLKNDFLLKADNSPVSKGDLLAQNLIVSSLTKYIPEILILSEELRFDKFNPKKDDIFAVIDPIDGTENFISGLDIWGVAISIWKYPYHLSSFIYLPLLNKSLSTNQKIVYNTSRITGLSSSINNDFQKILKSESEFRIMGCSVYNFYNVITGSFSSFVNPKGAYVWDLLAGINLALEHKYEVIVNGEKYNGQFLDPNKRHSFKVSKP